MGISDYSVIDIIFLLFFFSFLSPALTLFCSFPLLPPAVPFSPS